MNTLLALMLVFGASDYMLTPLTRSDPFIERGNQALAEGDNETALKAYDRAGRHGADTHVIEYNKAVVKLIEGDVESADKGFTTALGSSEKTLRAIAHYNLGISGFASSDLDGAIKHFSESLKIAPGFEPARRNLERALRLKDARVQQQQEQQPQEGESGDQQDQQQDQQQQEGENQEGDQQDQQQQQQAENGEQDQEDGEEPAEQQAADGDQGEEGDESESAAAMGEEDEERQAEEEAAAAAMAEAGSEEDQAREQAEAILQMLPREPLTPLALEQLRRSGAEESVDKPW